MGRLNGGEITLDESNALTLLPSRLRSSLNHADTCSEVPGPSTQIDSDVPMAGVWRPKHDRRLPVKATEVPKTPIMPIARKIVIIEKLNVGGVVDRDYDLVIGVNPSIPVIEIHQRFLHENSALMSGDAH